MKQFAYRIGTMLTVSLVLSLAMLSGACSMVSPNPGEEAVLVQKPMIFGHGGIDQEVVKTGRSFVALTTHADYVNMYPQRVDIEFDDLMTKDGVPLDFHAVVNFRVTDSRRLVAEYGNDLLGSEKATVPGFFVRNIDQPFRTIVRNAVKTHGLNEMAIDTTAAEVVDRKVEEELKQIILSTKVPIQLLSVQLGRANPPDAIKTQRVETAAQEQRIQTETQRKLAEDMRKGAEEARAAADAAYNYKMQLTPDMYLRLETIKMQRDVCSHGGCYFGFAPTWTQGMK